MNISTQNVPLRTRTVGDIAAAVPGAAEVFRGFKLDFCCGGSWHALYKGSAKVTNDLMERLRRSKAMVKDHSTETEVVITAANPRSSSSLVPMLVGGIVLTVVGMLAALAFS